jgi:hypothetical protein
MGVQMNTIMKVAVTANLMAASKKRASVRLVKPSKRR